MKKFFVVLLTLCVAFTAFAEGNKEAASAKAAANFPSKGINVICPWAAGGGTDAILRAACSTAEKYLGQTLTVENRTGGGGAIGHAAIKDAKDDGYTIGMVTFELNSLPPQGLIDFTYADYSPICLLNIDAAAITVNANAPYKTLDEFIAYCKQNPGKVTIGNSAPGSVWHIAAGLFANQAGIDVKHVAFEGAAPAVTQLAGGHIDAVAVSVAEVKSQVLAGNLRILGVMDSKRPADFPDVKTFAELGYPVEYGTWRGMACPKTTDPSVVAKLEEAFAKVAKDPEFLALAANLGQAVVYKNSKDFGSFLAQNYADTVKTLEETHLLEN